MGKKLQKSSYRYSVSDDFFVGLPSSGLKGIWVQLIAEPDGPAAVVPIGHIGPWNGGSWNGKYDDRYWRKRKRQKQNQARISKVEKPPKQECRFPILSGRQWDFGKRKTIQVRWQFVPSTRSKKVIVAKGKKRSYFTN